MKTRREINIYLESKSVICKETIRNRTQTINEIIYETGYNDIDAFRKVFKKITDLSPVDYRKKYLG